MKVILLSGKAEAGKSELGKFLKENLESQGKRVCIMRFAQYLKMYLKEFYHWNGVDKNIEIRNKLQWLGTDRIRQELNKPLFHCSRICEDIEILSPDFDVFILDDTRFKNEILYTQAVFPSNVTTIRVHRLGHKSKLTEEQLNHISETDLDNFNFDYNIYVQNGLDHLHDETDRLFKGVLY